MTQDERDQQPSEGTDAQTAERNARLSKNQPEAGFPAGDTEPYGDEDVSHEHPEDVGDTADDRTQSPGTPPPNPA
jgi:hypothetical protein